MCDFLFVSGAPRSGTTLLELILSSHPEVSVSPETGFIQQTFSKKYSRNKELTQQQIIELLDIMERDKKVMSWPHFNICDFKQFLRSKSQITYPVILKELFRYFSISNGRDVARLKFLGNKKGVYVSHANYTKSLFPEAKFIYIIRDPRDVVLSNIKTFGKNYERVARGISKIAGQIKKNSEKWKKDVMVIRYETLLSLPIDTCKEICKFIEVDFDKSMFNFYKGNSRGEKLLSCKKDIHPKTTGPIDVSQINKWQNGLSKKQAKRIEQLAPIFFEEFDYNYS